jgi:hypothetical protein
LNKISQHIDPLCFPLFFPNGDLGWSDKFPKNPNSKDYLTVLQYYEYRLSYRPNEIIFNPLLYGGRLTQQFFINAYMIIETNRLNWLRYDQDALRISSYQGLLDHIKNSAANDSSNYKTKERLGNLFILPSTCTGSPRYMQQNYQDAMAIMRKKGNPDLFVTMTCNPKWKELKLVLKKFPKSTMPNDIPNITVRLFFFKFESLLDDIVKKEIFGKVAAYVYTVEFQKRGLPHAHLLITFHKNNKIYTPNQIDKIISAEIPSNDLQLKKLVIKHMLHGPHTSKSPCYNKDNVKLCTKNFPKPFTNITTFEKNGYPRYRRKDNKIENNMYRIKYSNDQIPVDNSWVVPYNPFLLKKYKCHINVEYCASIQSYKYIFDYIHKGHDRAFCKIEKVKDSICNEKDNLAEISKYVDGRYLSPMEVAWRIERFPLCGKSHHVERLAVHTENQQKLTFMEKKEDAALKKWKTTLIAWFELNKTDTYAKNIKYINIPEHYTFDMKNKIWKRRMRNRKNETIGRISVVSPKDTERFFLKLLLHKVTGATCYEDLRTINNIVYNTNKDAAIALGLIEDDVYIDNIFEEAVTLMMPNQLQKFFAWFLICENINGKRIWDKFKKYFIEEFFNNNENKALLEIEKILKQDDKSCSDFGLPIPIWSDIIDNDELIIDGKKLFEDMFKQLNDDQLLVFNEIVEQKKMIHFIDGPGGSGKTFLYKTLIYYFNSIGKKIVSMAWTGIASILLPKGMTAHKTFRLSLYLEEIESALINNDLGKKN